MRKQEKNKEILGRIIGTQTVMPFGSPEKVDRVCKEMIEKMGKGGGFILSPTHVIEPEVLGGIWKQ